MKVLLATDGTPGSIEAAHEVLRLLHPDVELDVVTVIPETEDPMAMAGGFEGPLVTEEEAEAEHRRDEAEGRAAIESTLAAVGAQAESEMIESSDPGRAICDLAAQRGVDLLVVGGSEKGFLQRLLHRSVMEYAAHHAPCPVLIVRHSGGDETS